MYTTHFLQLGFVHFCMACISTPAISKSSEKFLVALLHWGWNSLLLSAALNFLSQDDLPHQWYL